MLVFHTPLSLLHDPPYEILSGCAQPYLESPDRIALILSSLLKEGREDPAMRVEERRCDWSRSDIASDTALFEAVARVHDREYLNFLREIYEEWVAEGGSKVPRAPLSEVRCGSSLRRARLSKLPGRGPAGIVPSSGPAART